MVIISFSVLEDKILAGTKTRTMRPAVYAGKENTKWGRVYAKWNYPLPIQISIPLQVYWKSRSNKILGYQCRQCQDLNPTLECPCVKCGYNKDLPLEIKERHKMFDAVLVNITKKKLRDVTEEEWLMDGFTDFQKEGYHSAQSLGLVWFGSTYKIPLENPVLPCSLMFPDYYNPALLDFAVYVIEFRRVSP